MTPTQVMFVVSVCLPVVCISILLSLFVPQEKLMQSVVVVIMVYFVIGFFGYLRAYAKEQMEKKVQRQNYEE